MSELTLLLFDVAVDRGEDGGDLLLFWERGERDFYSL